MSAVSFSVLRDVKRPLDVTLAGRNKSAIVAQLMRAAAEREQRKRARRAAVERIVERRGAAPRRTDAELRKSRLQGRP